MTPRLDGGPILEQCSTEIGEHETAGELEHRLSELGTEIVAVHSTSYPRQWIWMTLRTWG